jgi:hypothetical protein
MFQIASFAFVLPATLLLAAPSAAQQRTCFHGMVPLQPTNFSNEPITIPRFDQDLGILTAIEFTLQGAAAGSAGIEALEPAPTTWTTVFQVTLTLTRPDASILVVAEPRASFDDDLSEFDGVVDFRGTSGITHSGIVAMEIRAAYSPPPASDLALFTGPPGNPGTITLLVNGVGSSTVTGPGSCISHMIHSAGADVSVCYIYELDCNDNGAPDGEDIAHGTSADCNGNGVPDECERDPGFRYCFGVGCPCGNDDGLAGCANSSGRGALLSGAGSASLLADDLLMIGSELIPDQSAILFSADVALNGCAGNAFGDGLRCAGQNVRRLQASLPDANGEAHFGPGLLALEQSPLPGDERRYQIWYRDPLGPCGLTFNLTNGFSVTYGP